MGGGGIKNNDGDNKNKFKNALQWCMLY
jgi:hypothetical protein